MTVELELYKCFLKIYLECINLMIIFSQKTNNKEYENNWGLG